MKKWIIPAISILTAFSVDAFDCKVVVTRSDVYRQRWLYTPADAALVPSLASEFYKGENFFLNLKIIDPARSIKKQFNTVFDVKIMRPNGSVLYHKKKFPGLKGDKSGDASFYLADGHLKMNIPQKESLGKYDIEVVANDLVSGKFAKSIWSINIVEFKPAGPMSQAEARGLMKHYYLVPTPKKLIPAFIAMFNDDTWMKNKKANPFYPVMSFYSTAFNDNKYQISYLQEMYKKLKPKTQLYLLSLFSFLDWEFRPFIAELPKKQAMFYKKAKRQKNPLDFAKALYPWHLDILWARFMATGNYKPIKQIIDAMSLVKVGMSPQLFKQTYTDTKIKPSTKVVQQLYQTMAGMTASWSLTSNSRQHQLVRLYCEYTLLKGNESILIKAMLNKVLKSSLPPAPITP